MLPRIVVDDAKCPDALACRKCLLICPTRVLGLGTDVGPQKYQELEPEHFIVRGVREQFCTACMKCAEVCPYGAIQVVVDRGVTA
ncbi:MAG: 4Fe-4S binding protein [Dehalococcoidia bacterium]